MGSPCLQPLRILNCSVGKPYTTETPINFFLVSLLPSRIFIHFQKLGPNTNISKVFWMKEKETLSKAFSKSTIIARPGCLCLMACSKVSLQFLVASLINLLGMYAFWCGPRILFNTFLSLSAMILLISLYNVFSSVSGRQFARCL